MSLALPGYNLYNDTKLIINPHHMEHETTTSRQAKRLDGKSNLMIALGAVVVILAVVAVANFGGDIFKGAKNISPDEAKARAENFINTNLVAAGTTATVTSVTDYSKALYKLAVKVGDNEIESFISKDGKQFFPQAMDIDAVANGTATGTDTAAASAPVIPADLPKTKKPVVEMFVMSECPYGLQMQKGMLPVMQTLGDKADIQVKFVNYAMHGKKEVDEQLRQYCINKEEDSKLISYLTCYSKSGNATACGTEASINESKISSCIAKADKEFKITESYNDKSTWNGSFPKFAIHDAENTKYGVQGSPTLVINGKEVQSNRDSASLLATICAAFEDAPEECSATLDAATPAPGFGTGTAAAGNAAECAPAT